MSTRLGEFMRQTPRNKLITSLIIVYNPKEETCPCTIAWVVNLRILGKSIKLEGNKIRNRSLRLLK